MTGSVPVAVWHWVPCVTVMPERSSMNEFTYPFDIDCVLCSSYRLQQGQSGGMP
jgi:hypothetical protein